MVGKIRQTLRNLNPVSRAARKIAKVEKAASHLRRQAAFSGSVVAPRASVTNRVVRRWTNTADRTNAKAGVKLASAEYHTAKANAYAARAVGMSSLNPLRFFFMGLSAYHTKIAGMKAKKAGRLRASTTLFEEARRRGESASRDLVNARAEVLAAKARALESKIVAIEQRLVIDTPKRVKYIEKLRDLKKLDQVSIFLERSYLVGIGDLLRDKAIDRETKAFYRVRKATLSKILKENPGIIKDKINKLVGTAKSLEKRFLQAEKSEQERIANQILNLYIKAEKIRDLVSEPALLLQPNQEYLTQGMLRYNMDELLELLNIVE